MRNIITFSLFVISVFVVYGTNKCDSIKIFFALNKANFNPTLDNNAASMSKLIDSVTIAEKNRELDNILIYGYASPEGPFHNNVRLSAERCKSIADYINRKAGIPLSEINVSPRNVAWEGLRALVIQNYNTPMRDKVLQILDHYLPDACSDLALSEQCEKELRAIDNSYSYDWMRENLFPLLRYSLVTYTCNTPDNYINHPIPEIAGLETGLNLTQDLLCTPLILHNSLIINPLHRIALKTNLLYYGLLLPNLEVEWLADDKWSVALEGAVAWWGKYSKDQSYRLAMISPEVKRWINPRAPWHGFYAGVFAGAGLYDLERPGHGKGYYGEGLMGGISAGYMWPVSRCLSLEAAIGAGYMYTRCKEYKPIEGHHVYQRTKDIHYFGPLKLKFSLVWRLWDVNKPKQQSVENETLMQYEK